MWVLCDGIDLNFFLSEFKIQKYRYFNMFLIAQWGKVANNCDFADLCFGPDLKQGTDYFFSDKK